MLKHNFKRVVAGLCGLAATLFFSMTIFSCKSADVVEAEPVDILKLIDSEASFFVYIPVPANQEFIEYTLQKMADLSQSDARTIAERSKNIAISTSGADSYQIAIEGKFPAFGIKSAMSEKNGWVTSYTSDTEIPLAYYSNSKKNIQTSSPVTTVLMASPEVLPMLKRFNQEAFKKTLTEVQDKTVAENAGTFTYDYSTLPGFEASSQDDTVKTLSTEEIYEFLLDNHDTEIKFYSNKPASVLKSFLGKAINLGINSLSGKLVQSKADKTFAVTLDLELTSPSITKAACKMLKIALFPIPAKIVITGPAKVQITDISLTYNQLIKMIMQ